MLATYSGLMARLQAEVERMAEEAQALRTPGSWGHSIAAAELLGMELVHEYNTRSG